MNYSIPEEAKAQIVELREEGMGWTAISRFIDDEYGISLHRSTIQRWHAEHGAEQIILDLDDTDDEFIDAKLKLERRSGHWSKIESYTDHCTTRLLTQITVLM